MINSNYIQQEIRDLEIKYYKITREEIEQRIKQKYSSFISNMQSYSFLFDLYTKVTDDIILERRNGEIRS